MGTDHPAYWSTGGLIVVRRIGVLQPLTKELSAGEMAPVAVWQGNDGNPGLRGAA